VIYQRILDNITYYKNYEDGNKQIFSGILTYKNKTWVCDGYTKIFAYMLSIAGIEDVEIKKWYAIDTVVFPKTWHAWVRIGKYYYDPTFDDPIWWDETKKKRVNLYYKLPYDLMYVNRFDGMVLKKEYDWLDLKAREKIVLKNMYALYNTYKDYSLMWGVKKRKYLWLSYDEDISITTLEKYNTIYEVRDSIFYNKSWEKFIINGWSYYFLDDKNIENILLDPKVDLTKSKFFKWYDQDGKIQYRLGIDLIYVK
jgi:hypothetical protein